MKPPLLIFFILIALTASAQRPEAVLMKNKIELPAPPKSIGNYTSVVRVGNLLFLSGRGPMQLDGTYVVGKLVKDLSVQQGYDAAKLCALAQLAVLKAELGELSRIKRIVKVTGFVNGIDTFTDQPKVINGFSDLMVAVFGNIGIHTRSAVGVSSLPGGWPIEVEMIVEIKE